MSDEADGARAPLNHTRQVTIDALCEHFANDVMTVEEFERRVEDAHRASSVDELKDLLRDLPGSGDLPAVVDGQLPAPVADYSISTAVDEKEREFIVAVMGGGGRAGRWRPARRNFTVAIMGGAELDFRAAVMRPGITDLHIYTMWGGVEVIVPPGMNVECHGIALMGGFDHSADHLVAPDAGAPTLRITGVALMGGVEVSVRHPGESARDARRRRKIERRELRKRLRD